MDTNQFIKDATRTESVIEQFKVQPELIRPIVNAFIAAGIMLDQIKRQAYYGVNLNLDKMNKAMSTLEDEVDTLNALCRNGVTNVCTSPTSNIPGDARLIHGLIGCMTESAELAEVLIGYLDTGMVDAVNVQEECFDTMWYQAIIHDTLNLDMDQTAERGINKLKARFPDKFTTHHAVERNLDAERNILEGGE